jgi:hypothetical protein
VSRLEDEDGIDGPFDRAMDRAIAEDQRAARIRGKRAEVIVIDDPIPAIPRETVLRGVDMMAAELVNFLPLDQAKERARNMAQALQDGVEDPIEVVRTALGGRLEELDFGPRTLALARVARAWTSTVQTRVYRETEAFTVEKTALDGYTVSREELEAASKAGGGLVRKKVLEATYPGTRWATTPEEELAALNLQEAAEDIDDREEDEDGFERTCPHCGETHCEGAESGDAFDCERDECGRCGGSGGGPDRALKCPACGGSGRSRASVERDEEERAEYLADCAADAAFDEDDLSW